MLIALTAMGLFSPVISEAKSNCYQPQLISYYKTDSTELKQQEFVGTTIRWIPNNRNYIMTVAHGVVNADRVIGICGDTKVEMKIVGVDTDRDTALLESTSSDVSFEPFFKLPQGDHDIAQRNALNRLKKPNNNETPRSKIPFPFPTFINDKSLQHLSIMHPFFSTSDLAERTFEVAVLNWKPLIRKDAGIFEFQNNGMISQMIIDKKYSGTLQNPFASFEPLYLSAGVRPGMSGSPVFEYLDRDLYALNNLFTGMVSKTQSFKRMTLLIPAKVVESAITDILANKITPDEHMGYVFDKKRGRQYPYYSSKSLGTSFTNACDADFAHTSDLQSSRGGDWGDGGGSQKDRAHYIYSPFFTDSRFVPPMSCDRAGVIDSKNNHYVAYRLKDQIYPLRNLDQFMNYKRAYQNVPSVLKLIRADELPQYRKEICKQYAQKSFVGFKTSLIRQFSEDNVRDKSDGVTIPNGVIFKGKDAYGKFACDSEGNLTVKVVSPVIFDSTLNLFELEMNDNGNTTSLIASVGRCKITAEGKNFGFERIFKHPDAEIRLLFEAPNTWAINIGQIDKKCGLISESNAAIRIDAEIEDAEKMGWFLLMPFE